MKATLKLVSGVNFSGLADSCYPVMIDGSPDIGGQGRGARPLELLLLGMGGCTAMDVMHILKKARQQLDDCRIELTAERATEDPRVFTRIHVQYTFVGKDLKVAAIERAIRLSADKYCSASVMLGKTAAITHDYEIVEAG